ELEAQTAADAFIIAHRRGPRAIEALDALTKALPDDAWVFRMELRPNQVLLAGFSSDVPQLLERLTAAPFSSPELTSPVVHGVANGRSRFELRAQIRASES